MKRIDIRVTDEVLLALKEIRSRGFNVSEFIRKAILEKARKIKKIERLKL